MLRAPFGHLQGRDKRRSGGAHVRKQCCFGDGHSYRFSHERAQWLELGTNKCSTEKSSRLRHVNGMYKLNLVCQATSALLGS